MVFSFCHLGFSIATILLVLPSKSEAVLEEDVKLWVFGDSLSDVGNLSLLYATDGNDDTFLPPEAYTPFSPLEGVTLQRISNGKTLIEYVAEECYDTTLLPSGLATAIGPEAANTFAIIGAHATLTSPLDLPYQVAQFAATGLDVTADRAVVFIGANDAFAAWNAALEPLATGVSLDFDLAAGTAIVDAAITSIRDYTIGTGGSVPLADGTMAPVPSLSMLGIDKFVLPNIPNLSHTPLAINTATNTPDPEATLALASHLSIYFNEQFDNLVSEIEHAGYETQLVDFNQAFQRIRERFRKFGFTNRDEECFYRGTLVLSSSSISAKIPY